MSMIPAQDIRSRVIPLYELLTYGRMDQSGDFCEGAHLTRDQALLIAVTVCRSAEDELPAMDAAAIDWIARNMPADGSSLK